MVEICASWVLMESSGMGARGIAIGDERGVSVEETGMDSLGEEMGVVSLGEEMCSFVCDKGWDGFSIEESGGLERVRTSWALVGAAIISWIGFVGVATLSSRSLLFSAS